MKNTIVKRGEGADRNAAQEMMVFREAAIEGVKDAEKRIINVSFSSEAAVRDWFNSTNVLGHKPGEVDLKRLNNTGPVLMNHDIRHHVGAVMRAWLDEGGKRCQAEVKIARGGEADEVWMKIEDGILKGISVGAFVHERKLISEKDGVRNYRSTKWEPGEISLTPVPADTRIGVGRNKGIKDMQQEENNGNNGGAAEYVVPAECQQANDGAVTRAAQVPPAAAVSHEPERGLSQSEIGQITRMGREYGFSSDALDAIESNERPDAFAQRCLKKMRDASHAGGVPANRDSALNLNQKEVSRFSLAKLLRSRVFPGNQQYQESAQFELECVRAIKGEEGNTVSIPSEVMRQWGGVSRVANISANPGNLDGFIQDHLLVNHFAEALRAESNILQQVTILHGLKGKNSFPIGTKNSAAGWVGLNAALPVTDVETSKKSITPSKLGGIFKVNSDSLVFAEMAVEQMLRQNITEAIAYAMHRAIFYGSGAGDEPAGLLNVEGVNKVKFAADMPTQKELSALHLAIKRKLAANGALSYHFSAGMEDHFLNTPRSNGSQAPILDALSSKLLGRDYEASEIINDGHIFYGKFAEIYIGMWEDFKIEVNPYGAGWASNEIAMKAYQIAGMAVRRPEAFAFGSV